MELKNLLHKAKQFAEYHHNGPNHLYDGQPYVYHLDMVFKVAEKFIHLVPKDKRDIVFAACWCHDTIEDCRVTYNDIKAELGQEIADIVYALTNEKGKTRKDRANDKYYQGIRETEFATFVKMCDRIANIQYSYSMRSRMSDMYKKETPSFINSIYDERYSEMFEYLENLVGLNNFVLNSQK